MGWGATVWDSIFYLGFMFEAVWNHCLEPPPLSAADSKVSTIPCRPQRHLFHHCWVCRGGPLQSRRRPTQRDSGAGGALIDLGGVSNEHPYPSHWCWGQLMAQEGHFAGPKPTHLPFLENPSDGVGSHHITVWITLDGYVYMTLWCIFT